MSRFRIAVSSDELDVGRCVSSGQVFRWIREPEGAWFGVEGEHWYRARGNGDVIDVETSADEETFRSLFRLDWRASEILERLIEQGPELAPYLHALPGLRVMRPTDPVETFFCFLCTPNNNVARITSLVRKLAEYGEQMEGPGQLRRFPDVGRIAAISEADLRAKAFGYRGATIPNIAGELLARGGRSYLEALKGATYAEAHRELCSFKGIGPKLADCIALFALDHTESVPVDTHLWQAATRVYFPQWQGAALTEVRYRAVGDLFRSRFGSLAAWAHQYLFYDHLLGRASGHNPVLPRPFI